MPGSGSAARRAVRVAVVALAIGLVAPSCSSGDDFHLGNAMTVRRQVNHYTGRQHLSIADHFEVGTELCDGAVNDRARLLELAEELDLATYTDADTAAAGLWRGAYETCPGAIDDDRTSPPFEVAPVLAPSIVEVAGFPSTFPAFADVSFLDSQIVEWREGVEVGLYSTTTVEARESLERIVADLPAGWTTGRLVGPVTDIAGFDTYSVDIDGFGWSGTLDALHGPSGSFGEPERETFVVIVLIPDAG